MVIQPDEFERLKSGLFEVDCPEMELTRTDGTRYCSGSGCIRQRQSGGFDIKVFVAGPLDLHQYVGDWQRIQEGVLCSEDIQVSLRAADTRGRVWTASQILRPEPDGVVGAAAHALAASCREIVTRRQLPTHGSGLSLHAFAKVEFPRTLPSVSEVQIGGKLQRQTMRLNAANTECCGFSFLLEDDVGQLNVRATSEANVLPVRAESRISEALLFALGRSVPWSVLVSQEGGQEVAKLRSPERKPVGVMRLRPVRFQEIDGTGSVWKLFGLYLGRVLKDTEHSFHPLSAQVLALTSSMDGALEAQALEATVAVESVLKYGYDKVGEVDEPTVRAIDDLLDYLGEWSGDERVRRRAIGSVGMLKSARPRDRLDELVRRGVVGEESVIAWGKLRNAVTHGDWSGVQELQPFMDQIGKVHVLFYQLIFFLIGFAGKQTDWGGHGWPLIDYPIRLSEPSPEPAKDT